MTIDIIFKVKIDTNHIGKANFDFDQLRVAENDGLNTCGGELTLKVKVRMAA